MKARAPTDPPNLPVTTFKLPISSTRCQINEVPQQTLQKRSRPRFPLHPWQVNAPHRHRATTDRHPPDQYCGSRPQPAWLAGQSAGEPQALEICPQHRCFYSSPSLFFTVWKLGCSLDLVKTGEDADWQMGPDSQTDRHTERQTSCLYSVEDRVRD